MKHIIKIINDSFLEINLRFLISYFLYLKNELMLLIDLLFKKKNKDLSIINIHKKILDYTAGPHGIQMETDGSWRP